MRDLIVDLSTLTTIGKYNLDELVLKSIAVIGHDIEESLREHRNVISIDIGIGELHITNVDDNVLYKFIPSKKLEETVRKTYIDRKSPLALEVDEALGKRITNRYKDLF